MSRSLDLLDTRFRPMVDAFLTDCANNQIDLIVTCTFRSAAEQMALYAQGRTTPGPIVTRAKAGQSAHNYGFAIDVVPLVNGKPEWTGHNLVWQEVGRLGQARGMRWYGAPDSKFFEMPHFQHPDWFSLKTLTPAPVSAAPAGTRTP